MMKTLSLALLTPVLLSAAASAATVGTWSASGGANPGVDGWTQNLTGTGGWFQGDSASNAGGASGAGAGNPAWGFWSGSGGVSAATWNLAGGTATVGQSVSIDFDNGWVNSGGVGVQFLSGSNVAVAVFFNSGGPGYEVQEASGNINTGQGWTGDGFTISLTLTATSTYDLSFLGYNGTGGTLDNGALSFDSIRVYSSDPTGGGSGSNFDVFANNIDVVPEPSAMLLGGLGLLGLLRRRR